MLLKTSQNHFYPHIIKSEQCKPYTEREKVKAALCDPNPFETSDSIAAPNFDIALSARRRGR